MSIRCVAWLLIFLCGMADIWIQTQAAADILNKSDIVLGFSFAHLSPTNNQAIGKQAAQDLLGRVEDIFF